MKTPFPIYRTRCRGSATIEFALALPLLVLMCLGTADFGRLFFSGVTLANAAAAGAFFGAQSNINSGDSAGMQQLASDDARDLSGVTAVSSRFCDCPDAPADGPASPNAVDCIIAACPVDNYGLPRLFVRTRVHQTFRLLAPVPGIPGSTVVGRDAYVRVQ